MSTTYENNKKIAKALFESLDEDVLDILVVLSIKEVLGVVYEEKYIKALVRVHNYYATSEERIKLKDIL